MKMPEPTMRTHGAMPNSEKEWFTPEQMKQYGRDLLEEAAKACENYPEWANWGQTDNYTAANEGAQDCAAAIRKLKETL